MAVFLLLFLARSERRLADPSLVSNLPLPPGRDSEPHEMNIHAGVRTRYVIMDTSCINGKSVEVQYTQPPHDRVRSIPVTASHLQRDDCGDDKDTSRDDSSTSAMRGPDMRAMKICKRDRS